ncbi:hypothetical protein POVWA2_033810 [Plasmodium ovale wallikeri]|uniref:Secreted protein n=1 Tax=Plasmodium ovale wallikeri TaxID=864142 RepID=A0A1A8YHM3_PLAOA|nr:hypothetical protein POVWA1_005150 [Plasmodium ovale wallikeri]SBT37471.1 hypothetical protein POVWA2_033810 [Plasmodium ovale wallikeri]
MLRYLQRLPSFALLFCICPSVRSPVRSPVCSSVRPFLSQCVRRPFCPLSSLHNELVCIYANVKLCR